MTHSHVGHYSFIGKRTLNVVEQPEVVLLRRGAGHDMTYSYLWHDSFVFVTWLIHMCSITHSPVYGTIHAYVWHDSIMRVTWRIQMCAMTHSYVWHVLFMCVPYAFNYLIWLIHVCVMTHPYMTHSCVCHDSFICVTWLVHVSVHMCAMTHSCVLWLIHTCDMTHSCAWLRHYILPTSTVHTNTRRRQVWYMSHSCVWNDWCEVKDRWHTSMTSVRWHTSMTSVTLMTHLWYMNDVSVIDKRLMYHMMSNTYITLVSYEMSNQSLMWYTSTIAW